MNDFDFMKDDKAAKKVPKKIIKNKKQIATSGSPVITKEIKAEARKLAESSKGLDIAAFQRKHRIHVMNVDQLLHG